MVSGLFGRDGVAGTVGTVKDESALSASRGPHRLPLGKVPTGAQYAAAYSLHNRVTSESPGRRIQNPGPRRQNIPRNACKHFGGLCKPGLVISGLVVCVGVGLVCLLATSKCVFGWGKKHGDDSRGIRRWHSPSLFLIPVAACNVFEFQMPDRECDPDEW